MLELYKEPEYNVLYLPVKTVRSHSLMHQLPASAKLHRAIKLQREKPTPVSIYLYEPAESFSVCETQEFSKVCRVINLKATEEE